MWKFYLGRPIGVNNVRNTFFPLMGPQKELIGSEPSFLTLKAKKKKLEKEETSAWEGG